MLWKRIAIAGCLIFGATSTCSADWHSFWHGVNVDYQRNNNWPHPFREAAAAQTRMPFEVQRNNGWQLHNTLSHGQFRVGDGQLSYAGQTQLQNIVTVVPAEQRTVYVVRGTNQAETDARLASVRSSLERLRTEGGTSPQVLLIDRAPATNSGELASAVNRAWFKVLPKPQLPKSNAPSVSGGN